MINQLYSEAYNLTILIDSIMKAQGLFTRRVIKINQPFPFLQHAKLPNVKAYFYKGYQPHYKLFEKYSHLFPQETMVYCIDREAIDLGLEMSYRRKKMLTIVSDTHYCTVGIARNSLGDREIFLNWNESLGKNENQSHKVQNYLKQIPNQVSNMALEILKNYRFVLKSSFLDVHPLEAYAKMCGYLRQKKSQSVTSTFSTLKFSQELLVHSVLLVPFLSQMREKFLATEGLKLSKLERRQGVSLTPSVRSMYQTEWQKRVDFELIRRSSRTFEEKATLKWAVDNHLGTSISLYELINKNRYRHHHFGTWI